MNASAIPDGLLSIDGCIELDPSKTPLEDAGAVLDCRTAKASAITSAESSMRKAPAVATAVVFASGVAPPPPPQAVAMNTVEIRGAISVLRN